jgi:hypothetical protein
LFRAVFSEAEALDVGFDGGGDFEGEGEGGATVFSGDYRPGVLLDCF